jgi:hypothetical protein
MSMAARIICESAELALECLQGLQAVGLSAEPEVTADWLAAIAGALSAGPSAVAVTDPPSLAELVELSRLARAAGRPLVLAIVARGAESERLREAALDLGVTAVPEVEALVAALALVEAGADSPWTASLRALSKPERARLVPAAAQSVRSGGHLLRAEGGLIAWSADAAGPGLRLGRARDVALALAALRATDRDTPQVESSVDGVDERAVLEVLFGPRRALSDPASKAALAPYDLPFPLEELCASASRAAAEASRIGFPVRLSLTSPDLRVWDHPDLAVDMVDNAARVRDTFRQLMGAARGRLEQVATSDPRAIDRLLGVMVTATSEASALLGVRARPLPQSRVALEVGFADPHGAAAGDRTIALLPAPQTSIDRALRRLQGADLLFQGSTAQRRSRLDAIGDVLLRLSAFVNDRREEVESVELRPVAVLLDGSVEVREACVQVSDAFERSLSAPAAASGA